MIGGAEIIWINLLDRRIFGSVRAVVVTPSPVVFLLVNCTIKMTRSISLTRTSYVRIFNSSVMKKKLVAIFSSSKIRVSDREMTWSNTTRSNNRRSTHDIQCPCMLVVCVSRSVVHRSSVTRHRILTGSRRLDILGS